MKITITLDTSNAAFDLDNAGLEQEGSLFETARILQQVADRFAAGSWPLDGPLVDSNGNTVGHVSLERDPRRVAEGQTIQLDASGLFHELASPLERKPKKTEEEK